MYRSGLIGCGNIGAKYDEQNTSESVFTHAGMYHTAEAFQMVCAAEPDPRRRREFESVWNPGKMYASHLDLLAHETLDVISVATPDETHEAIIRDVLSLKPPKLLFTEKPIAQSTKSAMALLSLSRQTGTSIIVDYIRRWDKRHQEIRNFIAGGGLGPIQGISGYYVRGIRHNGCQMINLLRFLFGDITSVRTYGPANAGSFEDDPSLSSILTFDSGTCADIKALDTKGYGFSIFELDIFGKKGRIRLSDGGQTLDFFQPEPDPQFSNFKKLSKQKSQWEANTYGNAMVRAGRELSSILDGRISCSASPNSIMEAVQDLCIIEAAIESANNNHKEICVPNMKETIDE